MEFPKYGANRVEGLFCGRGAFSLHAHGDAYKANGKLVVSDYSAFCDSFVKFLKDEQVPCRDSPGILAWSVQEPPR